MFDLASVFVISVAVAAVTNQVTKKGWKGFLDSMIDHDEVQPKTEPKHCRRDNGIDQVMSSKFPETLKGDDTHDETNRAIHNV